MNDELSGKGHTLMILEELVGGRLCALPWVSKSRRRGFALDHRPGLPSLLVPTTKA